MTSGNGTTGTLTNGISYSGIPTWTTAAGTIGSFLRTTTPSVTVTVVASSDSAVTYSITSGALPTGFSLNTSTGAITGTVYNPGSVTTYNFSITATDAEGQTTARAFNMIFRDVQTVTHTSFWWWLWIRNRWSSW